MAVRTKLFLICALAFFCAAPGARAGRKFNGTTDLISIPAVGNVLDLNNQEAMTFSFWFYIPTAVPGTEVQPFGKGSDTNSTYVYSAIISLAGNAGKISGRWRQNIALNHDVLEVCPTILQPNTWYNFVGSYSTSTVAHPLYTGFAHVFLNGTLCASGGTGTNGALEGQSGNPNICIGGIANGATPGICTTANFPGTVAEVAVWNDELSVSQAKSLATVCPLAVPFGPSGGKIIGYWPLYAAHSPEPDLSGNVNSGTLTGTTLGNHPPCVPWPPKAPMLGASGGGGGPTCGPPTYPCSDANVTNAVALTTRPFFGVTGMGSYAAAPGAANPGSPAIDNAPVYRLTDSTLSYGGGASKSMFTNRSGAGFDFTWSLSSSNQRWLYTADNGAVGYFWLCVETTPISCSLQYKSNAVGMNLHVQPSFSTINPARFYYASNAGGTASGTQLRYQNPNDGAHTAATLFDFSTCSSWNPTLGAQTFDPIRPNVGDSMFATGFSVLNSGQNSGRIAAVYIPAGSFVAQGCYWVNTGNMQMYGPGGLIGSYNPSHGTFRMHQVAAARGNAVIMAKAPAENDDVFPVNAISNAAGTTTLTYSALSDGTQLIAGESLRIAGTVNYNGTVSLLTANATTATWAQVCGGCGAEAVGTATVVTDQGNDPFLWIPGASDLALNCLANKCSGHFVAGFTHFYNNYDTGLFAQKPFSAPGTVDFTFPSPNPCAGSQIFDVHPAILSDTGYMLYGTSSGIPLPDFTQPCTNEIIGIKVTNGTPSVKRFSQTWNASGWAFNCNWSVATFSQDGAFAAICSNMSNSLGDVNANPTCTGGTVGSGPLNGTGGNCRTDVFIVDLRHQ